MNYLENLKQLRAAVASEPAPLMYLDMWSHTPDTLDGSIAPACGTLHCTGGLAATMPYFQQLGMRADFTGAPIITGMAPSATLEYFFGRYDTPAEPYASLGAMYCIFAGFECGEWDRELAAAAGALVSDSEDKSEDFIDTDVMGHKDLALARIDKAIALWETK